MTDNEYEGLFEEREVELIGRWARRSGLQPDEIPDVLQEVAMDVCQQLEEWSAAQGADRKQMLWILTRNVSGKIKRADRRRRRRDEQKPNEFPGLALDLFLRSLFQPALE